MIKFIKKLSKKHFCEHLLDYYDVSEVKIKDHVKRNSRLKLKALIKYGFPVECSFRCKCGKVDKVVERYRDNELSSAGNLVFIRSPELKTKAERMVQEKLQELEEKLKEAK